MPTKSTEMTANYTLSLTDRPTIRKNIKLLGPSISKTLQRAIFVYFKTQTYLFKKTKWHVFGIFLPYNTYIWIIIKWVAVCIRAIYK